MTEPKKDTDNQEFLIDKKYQTKTVLNDISREEFLQILSKVSTPGKPKPPGKGKTKTSE